MYKTLRKRNRIFFRKTKKFVLFYLKKSGFIRDKRKKQPVYEKVLFRFAPVMFVVVLGLGFFHISPTNAFYNDTEISSGNTFSASLLAFQLTNNTLEKFIGPEALGEISHASVIMPEDGSLPMQYVLSSNILNENSGLCSKLTVEAKLNGVSKYSGPFSGLAFATTTEFGTWEFRFDMPPLTVASQGDKCKVEAVFHAWRADVADPAQSGYTDEEKITFSFTARMVVLNEIFARPSLTATAPKNREYVELYNNGSTPVDVSGWKISEIANSTETFYTIVASTTTTSQMQPFSGSTIIPANGFIVLVFGTVGAEHFNNTGDTVKLYDSSSALLDSHTYPAVSAGKAVVRFPDGIGFWVDPEPTPGEKNAVSMEDLKLAGFNDEMISQIMALASLKNESLQQKNPINLGTSTTTESVMIATSTDPGSVTSTTESASGDSSATTTPDILPADTASTTGATTENGPASNTTIPTEPAPTESTTTEPVVELEPTTVVVLVPVPESSPTIEPILAPVPEPAIVTEPTTN